MASNLMPLAVLVVILVVCGGGMSVGGQSVPASRPAAATTIALKGAKVTLSPPVLVAKRPKGPPVCYPKPVLLPGGEALLVIWLGGDNYGTIGDGQQGFTWSRDGGRTWTEPAFVPKTSANRHVVLPTGDLLLLPYALYPLGKGMGGPYYLLPKGGHEVKWVKEGAEFAGWPRADRSYSPGKGITGFVCHGSTLKCKDGTYIGTLYGQFADAKLNSLVLFESKDGLRWSLRSIIWDGKGEPLPRMTEGANESAMAFLKDGRLTCLIRGVPGRLMQTFSQDEGKTWTQPVISSAPGEVEPSLATLKDGALALASGRAMHLAFNLAGDGKDWQTVSILEHHNRHYPRDDPKGKGIYGWGTSGYPHLVALDDAHLLYAYDRWLADGSSIWVVQVAVEKD